MLTTWFMSPWQATRIALEAQHLMTFSVLRLLSGTHTQTAARLNDRDSADGQGSVTIKPLKPLAAHQILRVDKKRVRPTKKRSKPKGTNKSR